MLIRHADPDRDAEGCARVYAQFVDGSAASFEDHAPGPAELARRITRLSRTHPFLVADDDGSIAGFAYAGPHRDRAAYRWTCETTIYLDPAHHRRGLGRALYETLLELLERQGYRTVVAGISVPNDASVALHVATGFTHVGVLPRSGWKAGAWRDVAWMSRPLGSTEANADEPPAVGSAVRLAAPIELDRR